MLNPTEVIDYYYEKVKNYMIMWGVTWGILDSLLTVFQFGVKLVIVCKNIGKKQLTSKSIFKFVFLPGHELINLFPRVPEGGVRYQVHNDGVQIAGAEESTELLSVSQVRSGV